MKRVTKQYFCDRCGAEIPGKDLHYSSTNTQFVGVCGNTVFHIKTLHKEMTWRGQVHRTLVMCQSCWDELNAFYEKFMLNEESGKTK